MSASEGNEMVLRYALLALLTSSRPMTGYDLAKHFSQSVAHVWHAPDSQIYPELARMEADGLITSAEVPRGARASKKEYRITDAGIDAFRGWIDEPVRVRRQRDPAYLKGAYLEWADPDRARALLESHLTYWSDHLVLLRRTRESLLDRTHPTLRYRLETFPPEDHDRIIRFKLFAYDGLLQQAQTEIDWARRGLELLDSPD